MNTPTIYELCRPRADVLEGRIRDEDFAADLSQVLKGTAPGSTRTRPCSSRIRSTGLRIVLGGSGQAHQLRSQLGSILRLDTSYGGGKTYALIGLNHILTAADQILNLEEFIDPARLLSQKVTLAAFDGENADPMNGRRMEGNVLAFTLGSLLRLQARRAMSASAATVWSASGA